MSFLALRTSALCLFLAGIAYPQSAPFTCGTFAVNPIVHAEGIAESLGDIAINCSGGAAGSVISFNLAVFLNVNVTNRVTAANVTDILLTVNGVPSGVAGVLQTANSVAFNGISITVPTSGGVALRLTNLRGNVSQLGVGSPQPVFATIAINGVPSTIVGAITPNTNPLSVGVPERGLLSTLAGGGIRCTGSALPASITFTNLLTAGTRFASTRLTEGFATAFEKKLPGADTGVRIVVRYAGLPSGARLFVPDAVAGSDSVQPTAAGDLGGTPSGGAYAPGLGSLLLVRVSGTDANGAGGALAFTPGAPGSGTVALNAVSEVPLVSGAGIAVYEVVDSNPNLLETAQFPTFLGLAPILDGSSGPIASEDVFLGPVSTVFTASATDPIPRFLATPAPSDCSSLHDCGAFYFPALSLSVSRPLDFTAAAGSALQTKTVQIINSNGGAMNWTAIAANISGTANWLTVSPSSGVNSGTILVNVFPQRLTAPGVYTGTVIIDAGSQTGSRTLPVTLTITPASVTPPTAITSAVKVMSLASAARPDLTAVSPGSLAIVSGSHLKGKDVSVTFDSVAAAMLSGDDTSITVQLPASLRSPSSAQLQVVVDGVKSAPMSVPVSELAPAIFTTNGVRNQDWTPNSASNAAAAGSAIEIFSTGLMADIASPVFVRLHDRTLTPAWSGPAPGLIGIDQVNITIPDDLPAMSTQLAVCGYALTNPAQPVCSEPAIVSLK